MTSIGRRYPPIRPFWYATLRAIIRPLFRLLTRLRVEGLEQVPADGPMIFVVNHLDYLDSPLVFAVMPRHLHHLAAEKYEHHRIFGPLLRVAGAIFIQRGEVDRSAMRQALHVLEDGECLALAIEGTRSRTGGLQAGKTGVAYFATRTGAVLVPAAIWGTEQILPALRRLRRAEVNVRFGAPFRLPHGRATSAELDAYTDQIMLRLASMLPDSYRGVYRDRAGREITTLPEAAAR